MSLQGTMFAPDSDWRPPRMEDLPDWSQAKRIGLDIETCDPYLKKLGPSVRRGGFIAGVSFCIEDHQPFYLPTRHLGGDNLPEDQVLRYLRDQAKNFKGQVVTANGQYDFDYLAEQDIEFWHCDWRDVQIADPLINELHMSYSLANISERWGIPGKDETLLRQAAAEYGINPKSEMWKLPARYVGPYGEQDAILPLQLLRRQEKKIDELDIWDIYNLESRVQPVLLKMRRRGVLIDQDKLAQVEEWTYKQEQEMLRQVFKKTGIRIDAKDLNKADALAPALIHEGVIMTKTPTGKTSVDQLVLANAGEVGEWLMQARKVNKLRTTFVTSIQNHMVNGRVHCTFNQMRRQKETGDEGGARYGRLSSSDPNLQQQPSRDDFADFWRSIYIPDRGGLWACLDYSQQEPRWLVHFAELYRGWRGKRLDGAFEAAEMYRNDPNTDNHDMMTRMVHGKEVMNEPKDIFKKLRSDCKQIYLGLCYGMGGKKLAMKLGLPTKWVTNQRTGKSWEVAGDEAQALLDKFDDGAPFIKQIAKACEDRAKDKGIITTVLGRLCHFPMAEGGRGYDWTHKALNRLIQGSSADQMKKALVDIDDAGYELQLQVHDEVDLTVESPKEAKAIAQIMLDAVPCNVPHKVDVEIGPSWGEIKAAA